jgi:hypothetical protein
MSHQPDKRPERTVAELEAEVAQLTELLTVVEAARWFDRWHAFDGIKDDACPCCGGRIVVEETERIQDGRRVAPGVRLRAVPWS